MTGPLGAEGSKMSRATKGAFCGVGRAVAAAATCLAAVALLTLACVQVTGVAAAEVADGGNHSYRLSDRAFYCQNDGEKYTETGFVQVDGDYYYAVKGVWQNATTALVKGTAGARSGTWYVKGGKVLQKTKVVKLDDTYYLIKKGKLRKGYSGTYAYQGKRWLVLKGEAHKTWTKAGRALLKAYKWVSTHSLKEKVAQMFMVTPEQLASGGGTVTTVGSGLSKALKSYPVGGIIYFQRNLVSTGQAKRMLKATKRVYKANGAVTPFLAVDEEGGTVSRVGGNPGFGIAKAPSMQSVGKTKSAKRARAVGRRIGAYLGKLGFNMDMAPVADVLTNPSNTVIGSRSFGSSATLVSKMVLAEAKALKNKGILPVVKHFPGHGGTAGDSHKGYVYTNKTLRQLYKSELVPFADAVDAGVPAVMVGHISVPNITGNYLPASLSKYMVTDVLRNQMGFDGVVMTDSINMGAITSKYGVSKASVKAIRAGVDVVLMSSGFKGAYAAVLKAVKKGQISKSRVDESAMRILQAKYSMGL